ncbi:MAG TPA: Rrf2 family transcriptional regulator [Leptospiraceae bacterium]|nr:Rrf2 family transcriptional regulator [Leptospirales bacterium]HMX58910.1 Rrf2 family transcriptional regulator [Leptospiraceae bacterium]HMY46967.1 Rrf2 family transcriptional regulator [Leptospiraceae bacterium]HMZ37374.1 Rrf2 family transcriptional regulator [Leptospiraceae bacterium]HNJ34695.1 Rrf2 family transcriptional regulator [Leptospiraceae bacterium]
MSSRFAVAIHILTVLGLCTDKPVSSELIASSVNTNAVHIRRILSNLKQAGLIRTTRGSQGGYLLARSTGEISLRQVHCALGENLFHFPRSTPNKECPAGANIRSSLETVFGGATEAAHAHLDQTRLAHLVDEIRERSGQKGA